MSKLVSVAQLQLGDRFEFVSFRDDKFADSPGKDHPNMMVVASVPKVNRTASSCFFRYKSEADPIESRSWNGTDESEVRVFTDRAIEAKAPEAPTSAPSADIPKSIAPTNGHAPAKQFVPLSEQPIAGTIDFDKIDAPPEKPARKRAATKSAAEKPTKAAVAKIASAKTPAVKKKPAKAAPAPVPADVKSAPAKTSIGKPPPKKPSVKPTLKKKA